MNIKDGILRSAWVDYAARVMPPGVSRIQYEETRRGFYAGAIVVMGALEAVSRPGASEELGAAVLASINRECVGYAAEMKRAAEAERGAEAGRADGENRESPGD